MAITKHGSGNLIPEDDDAAQRRTAAAREWTEEDRRSLEAELEAEDEDGRASD